MFGKFLLRRLREPSTWAGLVTVVTAVAGVTLDAEQRDAVIAVGTALVGVLLAFVRESGDKEAREADKARAEADLGPVPELPQSKPSVAPEQPPTRGLQGRVGRNR